jgi:hypothetical protein
MPMWKTIFFRAAGFGAGVAAVLVIAVGLFAWYESRPAPPKPWKKDALTASYNKIGNSYDENIIQFIYLLKNTTDDDYLIDDPKDVKLTFVAGESHSLGPFGKFVEFDTPVYVPAKHTAEFIIKLKAKSGAILKRDPTDEEEEKYRQAVQKYLAGDLSGLKGFSLFDDRHRYEISFPPGWNDSKK